MSEEQIAEKTCDRRPFEVGDVVMLKPASRGMVVTDVRCASIVVVAFFEGESFNEFEICERCLLPFVETEHAGDVPA